MFSWFQSKMHLSWDRARVTGAGYPPAPAADRRTKVYRQWLESLPWEEVAERYASGATLAQLAGDLGVGTGVVHKRLAWLGTVTRRGPVRQSLDVTDQELRVEHNAGATIADLAERHQVSSATIWRHLNFDRSLDRPHKSVRPRGHQRSAQYRRWILELPWDELAERYRQGETVTATAIDVGVGVMTVHRHLKDRVHMRPRKEAAVVSMTGAELAAAHAAGVPITELARVCDTSWRTIKRRITAASVPKSSS